MSEFYRPSGLDEPELGPVSVSASSFSSLHVQLGPAAGLRIEEPARMPVFEGTWKPKKNRWQLWLIGILSAAAVGLSILCCCFIVSGNQTKAVSEPVQTAIQNTSVSSGVTQVRQFGKTQEFRIENYPKITVIMNECSVSEQWVEELFSTPELKMLPAVLKENCETIVLMDDENFVKANGSDSDTVVGFTPRYENTIYIRINQTGSYCQYTSAPVLTSTEIEKITFTIYHELGHVYDFGADSGSLPASEDEAFKSIYQANHGSLREYSSTNCKEFFADASAYYFLNPDYLRQNCYEAYSYLHSLYAG